MTIERCAPVYVGKELQRLRNPFGSMLRLENVITFKYSAGQHRHQLPPGHATSKACFLV